MKEEIDLAFRKLEELHPYMTLAELTQLMQDSIVYRNRAIIYGDNVIKRIIVKPNEIKTKEEILVESKSSAIEDEEEEEDICICSYHRPNCACFGICRLCEQPIKEYTTAKHELERKTK